MTKKCIQLCINSINDKIESNNLDKWRYKDLLRTKQWKDNEDVKRCYNHCISYNKFFTSCLKELNNELLKVSK